LLLSDFQDGIAVVRHREFKVTLENIVVANVRLANVATIVESESLAGVLLGGGDLVRERGLEMGYYSVNHIEVGLKLAQRKGTGQAAASTVSHLGLCAVKRETACLNTLLWNMLSCFTVHPRTPGV
jgi:hypothetical protein